MPTPSASIFHNNLNSARCPTELKFSRAVDHVDQPILSKPENDNSLPSNKTNATHAVIPIRSHEAINLSEFVVSHLLCVSLLLVVCILDAYILPDLTTRRNVRIRKSNASRCSGLVAQLRKEHKPVNIESSTENTHNEKDTHATHRQTDNQHRRTQSR